MIAKRNGLRQAGLLAYPGASIHFDVGGLCEFPEVQFEFGDVAILLLNQQAGTIAERFGGHVNGEFRGRRFGEDHGGGQEALPFAASQRGERNTQFFGIGGRDSQRCQDGLPNRNGGCMILAPDVPVAEFDSTDGGSAVE